MKTWLDKDRLSIEKQYLFATLILLTFIFLLYFIQGAIGYETVSMILLLIIFLLPLFNFSKGPIILAAIISALAWDYYFIPPHFTMHIAKPEDVMMLFMFFIVAVTNGVLSARVNIQKYNMSKMERRLNSLYNLVKDLSGTKNRDELFIKLVHNIDNVFGCETVVFLPGNTSQLSRTPHPAGTFIPDDMEWLAAEAAFKAKSSGGSTTQLVGNAEGFYYPVFNRNESILCMIGVKLSDSMRQDHDELEFLRRFIGESKPFLENFPV